MVKLIKKIIRVIKIIANSKILSVKYDGNFNLVYLKIIDTDGNIREMKREYDFNTGNILFEEINVKKKEDVVL